MRMGMRMCVQGCMILGVGLVLIINTFMSQKWGKKKNGYKLSEHHPISNHDNNNCRGRGMLPFDGLWAAGQSMLQYNAFNDMHASYYFGNPTVLTRMHKLSQSLCKAKGRNSYDNLVHDIQTQRSKIAQRLKKHESIENVKILPYSVGLRQQSQEKLGEFKKILKIKNIQKQHEHNQYLKYYWVNKQPDKPQIKMVRTLDDIANMNIVRLHNTGQYIVGESGAGRNGKMCRY